MDGIKKAMQGDLCYGKKALDKVVKWEGPMKFGDDQEAHMRYLYKIDTLADWVKKPEFLAAFPLVERTIKAAGQEEQQAAVKLTSQGWEPKELD